MSFDAVMGQEEAKKLIRAARARGRLGHAYLFGGPDGVGKTLLALELAKSLLCRSGGEPCDHCPDCRMVDHGRHPDVNLVQAEEGSRVIKIQQTQELSHYLALRPVQSERRVAIVREAERMNQEAANALLKTLEEPASFALLVLTSSRPHDLLPTIRSRCQELRFGPLAPDQIRPILSARPEFEEHEIQLAAHFSQGSAGKALQLLESGCLDAYERVLGRVLALPAEDSFTLADDILDWTGSVSRKLEPQRERLRELLRLLCCAYRDIVVLRVSGPSGALLNVDRAEPLARAAARLPMNRALRIIDSIQQARSQTDANAGLSLVLDNLFERIGDLQQAA